MSKPEAKKPIDWELIEKDWRAGIKSVLQIATEHNISHTAINKHFKKLGVPRDLKAKIKAKADALVSAAAVSAIVSTETKLADVEIIEANAQAVASVQLSHRKDIQRSRKLVISLLEELERVTGNNELFGQLAELLHAPDEKGWDKLNEIYRKVIDLPSRVDCTKKVAETLKVLIALEREAFGLDNDDQDGEKAGKLTDEQVNAKINALLNKARSAA